MKLHHSPTSPYVRKVMACAILRGIDDRMEVIDTNPHASPPHLLADNPLSKVPCLVPDDGPALCDSPVICEYLDSVGDAPPLFPPAGPERWRAQRLHALGDGILDAAVLRRMESQRPQEAARDAVMERQKAAVMRALDVLERDPPPSKLDIGGVAVACALGYLDFRFADEPWRATHPRLAGWYDTVKGEPALARTVPA